MNALQKLEATRDRRALIRNNPEIEAALYRVLDALVDTILRPPVTARGVCGIMGDAAYDASLPNQLVLAVPYERYMDLVTTTWSRFGEARTDRGWPTSGYFIPHPHHVVGMHAYNRCEGEEFWGYDYEYGRNRWDYVVHVIDTICEDLRHVER